MLTFLLKQLKTFKMLHKYFCDAKGIDRPIDNQWTEHEVGSFYIKYFVKFVNIIYCPVLVTIGCHF